MGDYVLQVPLPTTCQPTSVWDVLCSAMRKNSSSGVTMISDVVVRIRSIVSGFCILQLPDSESSPRHLQKILYPLHGCLGYETFRLQSDEYSKTNLGVVVEANHVGSLCQWRNKGCTLINTPPPYNHHTEGLFEAACWYIHTDAADDASYKYSSNRDKELTLASLPVMPWTLFFVHNFEYRMQDACRKLSTYIWIIGPFVHTPVVYQICSWRFSGARNVCPWEVSQRCLQSKTSLSEHNASIHLPYLPDIKVNSRHELLDF